MIKILYKGKILYPVSSAATATSVSSATRKDKDEEQQQQEWHLSQQLLELSLGCRNNVPCLWVMGTPARDVWLQQEQQQLLLQRQQQQQHLNDNDKNTSSFHSWTRPWHAIRTVTVRDAWHWGQWVVGWSVRSTWRTLSQCVHWLQQRQWPWWGGGAASSSNTATTTPSQHEHGD